MKGAELGGVGKLSRLRLTWLAAAAGFMIGHSSWADERIIRDRLPALLPGLPAIDEVAPVQAPGLSGLWAVRVGGHMLYTNSMATVLVEGQVIDLATKQNLTRQALDKALAVDFESLPLQEALVTHKQGTGARRIAVFADPTCGYCKQFEPMLVQLQDVTVYTFLVDFLGPNATDKGKRILCSKDPVAAWSAWMLQAREPDGLADCPQASALLRNRALANKVGVTGTPTALLTDRSRLPGFVPLDALRAALDRAHAAAPQAAAPQAAAPQAAAPQAAAPQAAAPQAAAPQAKP
jgi:thiol:disulfide interchange protein DsbC